LAVVGSVVNALAILRHLATAEPLGVNALARVLGLSPSSCFNILKTLVAEGFAEFDPETKTYRLGTAPGRLFGSGADLADWTRAMRDALAQLAQEFSITCGLWEVRAGRLVLVEVAESPLATRIHLTLGQRLPAHIGAMGRCIAARERLSLEEVAAIVSELRWQAPPTPERYYRDMRQAVARGWSVDEGNYLRGVTTVAAAVGDPAGRVRYCLTSTLFSGQFASAEITRIGERTAELARHGEARLEGGSGSRRAGPDDLVSPISKPHRPARARGRAPAS
jgi:DNA-binding IclR family transcriptional regulator